jgi:hypothetical protein
MTSLADPDELDRAEAAIEAWLAHLADTEREWVAAIDRGRPGERRWYVRLRGEEKDITTVWFTLQQRTLAYETYMMPAPEEREGELYEHLLRRNRSLYGVQFAIGDEDAVFLVGQLPVGLVSSIELDRVLGTVFATVERCFRPAMRIGYASKFRG